MKQISLIFLMGSVLFMFGCTKSNRPADLPTLYPCTITITQEDVPLPDALIELVPDDQTNWKWHTSAITDQSGKAVLLTYGFPGSLSGTFKVVVTKNVDGDFVYKTDPQGEQQVVSYKTYAMVQKQYGKAETTPHTIEVPTNKKGIGVTLDVGKSVKEQL